MLDSYVLNSCLAQPEQTEEKDMLIRKISAIALLFGIFAVSQAFSQVLAETTAQEVRKESGEAADAIASYTSDKKDEAVEAAKEALADLDARIEALQQRLKEKQAAWSGKMAVEKKEKLAELKKARAELSQRYEKLKKATRKAWNITRDAFVSSFRKLEHKLDELTAEAEG